MRSVLVVLVLGVLAGCGVDGAPERPEPRMSAEVSGEANVGVVGSF